MIRKLAFEALSSLTLLVAVIVGVLAMSATALADTAPTLTISAPTGPTATTVKVSGTVNPNGGPSTTTWGFQYSKEPVTEGWTPAGGITVSGEFAGPEAELKAPQPVGGTIEGLQPDSTYQMRLLATNAGGETASVEPNPTVKTVALAPAVDAQSASAVSSTSATLEAQVNANNQLTGYSFEYSTKETAGKLEGTIVKIAGAAELSATFGDQLASVATKPLLAGTTYFYRVTTKNATGVTNGSVQSLTTPPAPTTDAPTEVTTTTATLNGHLDLSPDEAQFNFAYNLGASCEGGPVVAATPPSGLGPGTLTPTTAALTELQPNALYTACFQTSNASGSQLGNPEPFKTLPLPPAIAAESELSSTVKQTTANLEAQINPNNQETTYHFDYSTEESGGVLSGTIQSAPGAVALTGFGNQPATVSLTGLKPRTKYFWRVVATNATAESSEGPTPVASFTTLDAPLVTTNAAQNVTRTTATISGTVNPGGLTTHDHFIVVSDSRFLPEAKGCFSPETPCAYVNGFGTAIETVEGTDYTAHPVGPVTVKELTPSTTYHYVLVSTNSTGTTFGPEQTFTTAPPTPPTATTGPASGVTQTSATITGSVNTEGLGTSEEFELTSTPSAPGTSLSTVRASVTSTSGSTDQISASFGADLQPGTTYYYRAVATNADGTSYGAQSSFTTVSFPSPFVAPSSAIPLLSYTSFAEIEANEAKNNKAATGAVPLTKAQKLTKALKVCHKSKSKAKRTKCERQAHSRYSTKKKH